MATAKDTRRDAVHQRRLKNRVQVGSRCPSCDRPFWRGPHPVTGRFLTYVEHSKEFPTHEMADLLRANGMSDNEFAELGLILPKHPGNA